MVLHTAVTQVKVMFVDAIKITLTITVWCFFADDHVLTKPLRQKKGYGAKKFVAEFPSNLWKLSGLNKWTLHILRRPHKSRC